MLEWIYRLFGASTIPEPSFDLSSPSRQKLIDYVDSRRKTVDRMVNWYKSHVVGYRVFSLLLRFLVLLVILYGGLVLAWPTTSDGKTSFLGLSFANQGNAALAAGVVAAILVAANQTFMISATWARYMLAQMDIEARQQKFVDEWTKLKSILTDENASTQRSSVVDLISNHIADVYGVMRAETASWGTELAAAMQRLEQMVQDQRSASEAFAKEQQRAVDAARPATSAVRIVIANYQNMNGPISAAIDAGKPTESATPAATLAVAAVAVGGHVVELKYKDKTGVARCLQEAFEVAAGKVAVVNFQIP